MDESGSRKAMQKFPGTPALQQEKSGTRFTPPKAIQKVTPKLSAALKKNISGEVPVDLRVSIDEEGNIFRTEVLPGKADNELLTLASDAAKRWRFEPARVNSKPVSSKVVLHFMFRNPI
jgi:TonB family protein